MNRYVSRYGLFYPVRYLRGEYIAGPLRDVRAVEGLSPDALREETWRRVRAAARRAGADIPYYEALFSRLGIDPSSWTSLEDFRQVPLLDKGTIREHQPAMRSRRRVRTSGRSTSGSTGAPFAFEKDAMAAAYMDAVMYHAYSWHGIEIGAPQGRFWGMPVAPRARRIARLKDLLMNRIRCSAFAMGEAELRAFHRRLMAFRPEYFYGYPSVMYEFARFLVDTRLPLPPNGLKAAIGTGELPLPQHREFIERAFATRFVNEYGCSEVGVIAFQCPRGRMHVMAHNVFVEIVDPETGRVLDSGQEGEIVVTELHATTVPFLRYRMHDRGTLVAGRCDCQLPLPQIEVSSGRLRGQLTLPSGRTVYDAIFSYTFKQGIAAFKAVQTASDQVRIFMIPDAGYSEALMAHYLDVLREKTFGEIRFSVEQVQTLPRERSGKLRYFVNELTSGTSWRADTPSDPPES